MFNKDRWEEILEVLTSNWFRTVLTAFGVLWGIFILLLLLAVGKGLENGIKQDFGDVATNTMFMWTRNTSLPYKGLPEGRRFNFKVDDVTAIQDKVPNLKYVSPRNQLGGFRGANNVVKGLNSGAFNVYGDYPEIIKQEPMNISSGRFLNHNDIRESRKIAVIGEGVQDVLYDDDEDPLGTFIKIQGVNFMVVGIYNVTSTGGDPEESQKQIFVPFTAFSKAFNRADNVGWMAITAKDGNSITDLKEAVMGVVRETRRVHPDDKRAIGHYDLFEEYNKVEGLFIAVRFIAYFVGVLVLLSGIIGVSNIMLIVVKERTKEIGVRRALGESPWSIKKQILMESVFLTLVSGMMGIVLGALTIYGINALLENAGSSEMFLNPSVSVAVVTGSLIILIFSGLLAGFIPANSAIKMRPIDALRTE